MSKKRKPGESISFKTRKNEHPLIMEWVNMQDNFTDSVRYLIENEIRENGLRNLQKYIPATRTLEIEEKTENKNEYKVNDNFDIIHDKPKREIKKIDSFSSKSTRKISSPDNEPSDEIADDDIDSWI